LAALKESYGVPVCQTLPRARDAHYDRPSIRFCDGLGCVQRSQKGIEIGQELDGMEVVYSSEGRQTMHIGARLPFEGDSLEVVIQMYAPVAYWREQELSVVVPQVGTSGGITSIVEEEPETISQP
jgi:hypothetical protein